MPISSAARSLPSAERRSMVDCQIAARGVRDERVLTAFRRVPREAFVPAALRTHAYEDRPLPIGAGQTISQPFIVALMTEALRLPPPAAGGAPTRVLEIGTGSGYAAAVLAEVADEVVTIERHGDLAERARRVFAELGYVNVRVVEGDGTRGWPQGAPYHGIVVAAGGPGVPRSLREQLAPGGRLVIPVGPADDVQKLVVIARLAGDRWSEEDLGEVRFVPLIGEEGWSEPGGSEPGGSDPGWSDPAAPAARFGE
jgi:protein-L-isoaspartate(D-aspartate) O-methyltransferase